MHQNNEYTLNLRLYKVKFWTFLLEWYKLLSCDYKIENLWLYKID